MSNKKIKLLNNLPVGFTVKLTKTSSGVFLAEIPELDTFTEVEKLEELEFAINDLIVTYFDIPTAQYKNIWYRPASKKPLLQKTYKYDLFTKPEAHFQHANC